MVESVRFPERMLAAAAQAVPTAIAIIVTDLTGRVTLWNDYASLLYGWSQDEALGRSIDELTVGPITQSVADDIMDQLRAGSHWSGTFEACRRSGELVRVNVLDAPVVDDDGNIVGIVGLSREDVNQIEQSLLELDELRELAGRLDEVRRSESRRIAAQVHDEFSQRLHLLIQQTSRLAADDALPAPARDALAELVSLEQELVGVMHGVCGSLRPPLLDELGVGAALEHLADSIQQLGPQVEVNLDPAVDQLPLATGEILLAVTQEALSNVLAHAEASSCAVRLELSGDRNVVTLEVTDDGAGFSGAQGFGLRLMRERVRRSGGTVEITASAVGGTSVLVRLPGPSAG